MSMVQELRAFGKSLSERFRRATAQMLLPEINMGYAMQNRKQRGASRRRDNNEKRYLADAF